MNALRHLRTGQRIAFGYGALLLCVVAAIGAWQMARIDNNVRDVDNNWVPSIQALGELQSAMDNVRRYTLRHVLESEPAGKRAQATQHDKLVNEGIPQALAKSDKLVSSLQEAQLMADIKSRWAAYPELDRQLLALSDRGDAGLAAARSLANGASATAFAAALVPISRRWRRCRPRALARSAMRWTSWTR